MKTKDDYYFWKLWWYCTMYHMTAENRMHVVDSARKTS